MTIRRVPAPRLSQSGDTIRVSMSAPSTAMALVATNAAAEPRNTGNLAEAPLANVNVATWVLSPNSARKTVPNVTSRSFQSMSEYWVCSQLGTESTARAANRGLVENCRTTFLRYHVVSMLGTRSETGRVGVERVRPPAPIMSEYAGRFRQGP